MKIDFYKTSGEKDLSVEYPKSLVSEISDAKLLEYIRYVRNSSRSVIASTKDRSEVSGTGKKPWKQKGTGRARHGSRRSPIFVGGGITFGPNNLRNYSLKMNKKERRSAILTIISSKVKDKVVCGISELKFSEPKTSKASSVIEKLPLSGKIGFFTSGDENSKKSFRNIAGVTLISAKHLDILSFLSADSLLFTKESLKDLEETFSSKEKADAKNHS
ncbi:MAG: 50S ribosomal protein L4 [Candidatus Berkelbacteria bacterium]|nr:50S ribosomal protein L4 [Candidatus Berkelbacteria bacterium]